MTTFDDILLLKRRPRLIIRYSRSNKFYDETLNAKISSLQPIFLEICTKNLEKIPNKLH